MAQTATRAADSELLAKHPLNHKLGDYTYQATSDGRTASYSVADSASSFSATLKWAFGIRMGQSYLFEKMAAFIWRLPIIRRQGFGISL